MEYILLICFLISFLASFFSIPFWINRAKKAGLIGKDMNKINGKEIAEAGGICVTIGFILGMLFYIALETFYFKNPSRTAQLMAVVASILIITIIGFIDDILGWRIGLRQIYKPILTLFAALPIVVVSLGFNTVTLPFLGRIELGIIYPLLFIPIAIIGASNGFNLLAGYNGLETGMGIIILTILGFAAWFIKESWASMIALIMVAALIAFYYYNRYPSKIFPGDTLTYIVGATIAITSIAGNTEKLALILFIPYFIELIIKAKNRFKTECFAIPQKDGSLKIDKIGSLTHVVIKVLSKIKNKVYEKDVVYTFLIIELILAGVTLLMWFK